MRTAIRDESLDLGMKVLGMKVLGISAGDAIRMDLGLTGKAAVATGLSRGIDRGGSEVLTP